jgi:hypothetical protein
MKLSLPPPKLLEKLVLSFELFRFVKFSFPVTCLMPYYVETGCSHPANCRTLQLTLLVRSYFFGVMVGFKSHEQCSRTYHQTFILCTKTSRHEPCDFTQNTIASHKKQQLVLRGV